VETFLSSSITLLTNSLLGLKLGTNDIIFI
jgi:hypothetical protein